MSKKKGRLWNIIDPKFNGECLSRDEQIKKDMTLKYPWSKIQWECLSRDEQIKKDMTLKYPWSKIQWGML